VRILQEKQEEPGASALEAIIFRLHLEACAAQMRGGQFA